MYITIEVKSKKHGGKIQILYTIEQQQQDVANQHTHIHI